MIVGCPVSEAFSLPVSIELPQERGWPLKVVIADDSSLIREQLVLLLSKVNGLVISGEAENGVEAMRLVEELSLDVLVLDISMPIKDGLAVLRELREAGHPTVVIIYTADTSPHLRELCMNAGADYFLGKGEFKRLLEICKFYISERT